jgi:BON domain
MKRIFFALPLLALATSMVVAQAPSSTQPDPNQQNKPGQTSQTETQNNTAGSISGNASPTNNAPGAQPSQNPTTPDPTAPTTEKPAAPPQQQQPTGQSPTLPQGSAAMPSSNVADSDTLKGQLDQAYQSEPSLSGSSIQVQVTDTAVQLSGTVPTGKEKTTAKRIAQSYAGNRKVVEKLTVNGRGNPSTQPSQTTPKQ